MRHVVFSVGGDRYALPLASIREIVLPPGEWTRVPRAPRSIRGVINLRGRVVTVVDLSALLGEESASEDVPTQRVVLLDFGRRDLGLLVTDVDGIEMIERIAPPAGDRQDATVKGVARVAGRAVTVLSPEGIDDAVAASVVARSA